MNKAAIHFATFVSLALISTPARAPIFGHYPGLSEMISGSDAIVVARIMAEPERRSPMGGFEDYTIQVLYTLKGDLPQGSNMKVSLRGLPLLVPLTSDAAGTPIPSDSALRKPFQSNEQFVFFLERDGYFFGKHHSRNSAGSSFWVTPTFDPSRLNPDDVRGNLEALFGEVVAYERLRGRNLDVVAAEYLAN